MRNVALRKWLFALLLMGAGTLLHATATATVTIGGSEQQINGVWDTDEITIYFNGFSETVTYGQFSTPASIASAFGGMFSRDYAQDGLCAHASGATITFQLKGDQTFGPISVTGSNTSFTVSTGGWVPEPPAPPAPPASGSCQQGRLYIDGGFDRPIWDRRPLASSQTAVGCAPMSKRGS